MTFTHPCMHTPTLPIFLYILIVTPRMCITYNMIVILIVAVNLNAVPLHQFSSLMPVGRDSY